MSNDDASEGYPTPANEFAILVKTFAPKEQQQWTYPGGPKDGSPKNSTHVDNLISHLKDTHKLDDESIDKIKWNYSGHQQAKMLFNYHNIFHTVFDDIVKFILSYYEHKNKRVVDMFLLQTNLSENKKGLRKHMEEKHVHTATRPPLNLQKEDFIVAVQCLPRKFVACWHAAFKVAHLERKQKKYGNFPTA